MIGFGSDKAQPMTADIVKYNLAQEFLTRPRSSLLLRLNNGDQMSYAEVGDTQGIPVIWFGGPNTNRFVIGLYEQIAIDLGIRLICFDRPGRGASTPLRRPKLWGFEQIADYIVEATDMLGIQKFHLVAHSLGTTYALAIYEQIKHKIIGPLRFLSLWAPTNTPCMPASYAMQRSLPTGIIRRLLRASQTSATYMQLPTQMGKLGTRERLQMEDTHSKEILECMQDELFAEDYTAYEVDWLLALEVRKPLTFDHKTLSCDIKCWHGMDDSITPLGAAMWVQREMKQFLLFAVEGASHNVFLDMSIVKALFSDISAQVMAATPIEDESMHLQMTKSVEAASADSKDLKSVHESPVENKESIEIK